MDIGLEIGMKVVWKRREFDGGRDYEAVITKVEQDYAIATTEGMSLWIDEDTICDFEIPLL